MIRANSSGPSNQTPGASAAESAEVNGAEIEGQEDSREFVVEVEEPEETPAMRDGLDLVRSHLIYWCSHVESSVGCHRTGYVVCDDSPRRDGSRSISQTIVLLQHLWC